MGLSDEEVYDRLHAALIALGEDPALSVAANNTLETARRALTALQMALIVAMDRDRGLSDTK